jgi:AcrR family transcriptional regulator
VAVRTQVLEAARSLFFRVGYLRATMQGVAAEAGVAVQTLYNTVGSKAAVLTAVFEATVSGVDAPRLAPEILQERAEAAPDGQAVIRLLAEWFAEVHDRMAPLWRLIEEAAGQDEAVARFARQRAHQRLLNYHRATELLRRRGALREGLAIEEAAAVIWSIGHPQVHRTLVVELKWPVARYVDWVETSLAAALLVPSPRRARRRARGW